MNDQGLREPGFQALFDEVMAGAERFGHRQHVHLTWLAVRRHGTADAITVVSEGIRATARYAGAPQKYHATVSRAWVEAVGYHAAEHPTDDFGEFAEASPGLLDKRLLSRFYSSAALASAAARSGWVEPDRDGFPWAAGSKPGPGVR
jgi:hypothetical protein